ncbi:DUF3068 domain-containing protein [Corynebacterium aquilae]|nr:DUF3068 domain-containing protein [Corynebacterium aquilae]
MLPRSRLAPIALVGLGALLLSVGFVLPMFFPADNRLPADLHGWTYRLTDPHAQVGDEQQGVYRQVHVDFTPSDDDEVLARVGSATMRMGDGPELERLLDAEVVSFRMDRLSGEAVGSATWATDLASPPRQQGMGGLWLKFPADTQPRSYGVFDPVTHQAILARFVGEDNVNGRRVYSFVQTVPNTVVVAPPEKEPSSGLGPRPEVLLDPAGDAVQGVIASGAPVERYQATRELEVDAATGVIVDMRVRANNWLEMPDGSRQPLLAFQGGFSDEDREAMWDVVRRFPSTTVIDDSSIVLLVLGSLSLVVGAATTVVGLRRPRWGRRG